jgi:hypothetical protein
MRLTLELPRRSTPTASHVTHRPIVAPDDHPVVIRSCTGTSAEVILEEPLDFAEVLVADVVLVVRGVMDLDRDQVGVAQDPQVVEQARHASPAVRPSATRIGIDRGKIDL